MVEIGWTEIIVAVVGLIGADTGIVAIVVKYFLDRQAKAEAGKTNADARKVDAESEKEAIGNASDALDMYNKIQDIVEEQVKKQMAPMIEESERNRKETERLKDEVAGLRDDLRQWGCWRGYRRDEVDNPDCESRMPKEYVDRMADKEVQG